MTATFARSGGQILVAALQAHQVDTIFCVPGESYLAVLDALYDADPPLRTITCRHEAGAANMAEAYGKLTGRPGIVMVTRGPGACHASIGLHIAAQDSTPLIAFIGQIKRSDRDREAFQEMNYRQFLGSVCKWVTEIETPERIPELVSQAFHRATSGRPGPVAIALPEDMLTETATVADTQTYQPVVPEPGPQAMAALRTELLSTKRPLIIAGGSGWSPSACADLQHFAETNRIPVVTSFRRQDRIDNRSECYIGALGLGLSPARSQAVSNADLIIAIGARLGEMTTDGYTLIEPPTPHQRIVHVHPDAEELNRVHRATVAINAGVAQFLIAAAAISPIPNNDTRTDWLHTGRQAYLADLEPTPGLPGTLQLGEIMVWLREHLAANAILTTDAGNFSEWMQRHYLYRNFPTQLGSTNGAMGYGVPAAVAASLLYPERTVVAFCGDGGMLMTGQEIATAMHHLAHPIVLVINNNMYGSIRAHQEHQYPDRISATALTNPNFAAWADSFGAFGLRIQRTEDFAAAFIKAEQCGRAAVLELMIDPDMINTRQSLSSLRPAPAN